MMSDDHAWTCEYDNHGNGGFAEWWNIMRDGRKVGLVSTSEEEAIAVCRRLNATEILNVEMIKKRMKGDTMFGVQLYCRRAKLEDRLNLPKDDEFDDYMEFDVAARKYITTLEGKE